MEKLNLLIVEDQENWQDVLRSLLLDIGYEVYVASNVEDAWDLLNTYKIDLSFIDIRLSENDYDDFQGLELLDRMKTSNLKSIPVIIVTGYSFNAFEDSIKSKYNIKDFLFKGTEDVFKEDNLIDLITRATRAEKP